MILICCGNMLSLYSSLSIQHDVCVYAMSADGDICRCMCDCCQDIASYTTCYVCIRSPSGREMYGLVLFGLIVATVVTQDMACLIGLGTWISLGLFWWLMTVLTPAQEVAFHNVLRSNEL